MVIVLLEVKNDPYVFSPVDVARAQGTAMVPTRKGVTPVARGAKQNDNCGACIHLPLSQVLCPCKIFSKRLCFEGMQKGIYRQTSIGVAAISFVLVEPVGTLAAPTTNIGTLCQLSPSIVTSSSKGNSSNYSMPAMILGLATELGSCSDAVFPCIVSPE